MIDFPDHLFGGSESEDFNSISDWALLEPVPKALPTAKPLPRSLAHDFGQALGVGAYLAALKRTRIGAYQLKDAYEVTNFDFTPLTRRFQEVSAS